MLKGKEILVVEDSASIREAVRAVLEEEGARVIEAGDPYDAVACMRRSVPDAILLDLELPRMTGVAFLQKLMAQHPLPVVVCSAQVGSRSSHVIAALELGAVEALAKPSSDNGLSWEDWALQLREAVARALAVTPRQIAPEQKQAKPTPERGFTQAPFGRTVSEPAPLIVIGASTGGTRALAEILPRFPSHTPGMVIVQHMPAAFTGPFAQHLDTLGTLRVKEASDGDVVQTGQVLLAPGGKQTRVRRFGGQWRVEVRVEGPHNRHCPSVDILFTSAAEAAKANCVAAILTGMGDDGARGMRHLHDAGARTLAQDEATCVVYGMPKEAVRHGGVDTSAPLATLPRLVLEAVCERRKEVVR